MHNIFRESEFSGEHTVRRPSRRQVPHDRHERRLNVGCRVVMLRRKGRGISLADCRQSRNLLLCEYFEAQSQNECTSEAPIELTPAVNSSFQELVKKLRFITRNRLPVTRPKDIKCSWNKTLATVSASEDQILTMRNVCRVQLVSKNHGDAEEYTNRTMNY